MMFSFGRKNLKPVKLHAVTTLPKGSQMKALSTLALIFALLHIASFNTRHWPEALGQQIYGALVSKSSLEPVAAMGLDLMCTGGTSVASGRHFRGADYLGH